MCLYPTAMTCVSSLVTICQESKVDNVDGREAHTIKEEQGMRFVFSELSVVGMLCYLFLRWSRMMGNHG